MLLIINALLIAACTHGEVATASTFRPWALNDSTAFVFPRIAEKRNRGLFAPSELLIRVCNIALRDENSIFYCTKSPLHRQLGLHHGQRFLGEGGQGRLRADGAALAAQAAEEPHVYVATAIRKGSAAAARRLGCGVEIVLQSLDSNHEQTDRRGLQEALPDGSNDVGAGERIR